INHLEFSECYGKTSTRWSSRGQNFFLIKGKNLGLILEDWKNFFDEKRVKCFIEGNKKKERFPNINEICFFLFFKEINASHNRISIYLHYRQIGAQPTRTNFERGSLIDGVFNGLENLSFDILIVRFSYEWTLYFFFLEILIILDYGLKRDYIDKETWKKNAFFLYFKEYIYAFFTTCETRIF
ncbi:hypothetical protein ACJX0J_002905, partial [Zea mays]